MPATSFARSNVRQRQWQTTLDERILHLVTTRVWSIDLPWVNFTVTGPAMPGVTRRLRRSMLKRYFGAFGGPPEAGVRLSESSSSGVKHRTFPSGEVSQSPLRH